MIEVRDLVKKYGEHYAVDHLSFRVEKGQIYGFLGPNGAGKSTTMNIITGYIGATSGDVIVNGKNILEEPEEAKKSIGYLPEIPPLYVDMEVEKYLKFVAELKRVSDKDVKAHVEKVIEMTNLSDMRNRIIANLSKGYRQRVGLAQAIIGFPAIIILDEPTVGLDPVQIIEIRQLIKELSKQHTIILSSHILSEIEAVCDHVLMINNGKLVLCDSLENIERHFKNRNRLLLKLKAPQKKVQEILSYVSDFENIAYSHDDEGLLNVMLTYPKEEDLREQIFYTFAKNDCALSEMSLVASSLEQIFIEMTNAAKEETGQ